MQLTEVLDGLVAHAPALIARAATQRNRCIFATRVGLEVLQALGVDAEPWPVEVRVVNEAARRLLIVGPESQGPGWSGHLVIRVPAAAALVDLDLQQFQRTPGVRQGIEQGPVMLPDAAVLPLPPDAAAPWSWVADPPPGTDAVGITLLHYWTLADDRWRKAPDWRTRFDAELRRDIGALIRRLR